MRKTHPVALFLSFHIAAPADIRARELTRKDMQKILDLDEKQKQSKRNASVNSVSDGRAANFAAPPVNANGEKDRSD